MGKLFYFPIVQAPDENWTLGTGHITEKMIDSFMPPKSKSLSFQIILALLDQDDSIILICGGP